MKKEKLCENFYFIPSGNRGHGLQLLGKVQSRRVLQPAVLPSLKRENLGNDPLVNLVPQGSQGWGKNKDTSNQQQKSDAASTVIHKV